MMARQKRYKVVDIQENETVFVGTTNECSIHFGVCTATIQAIASHRRVYKGKYMIYSDANAERKPNKNSVQKELKLVDMFYREYWRSPREKEFIACGGNMKNIKREYLRYNDFLLQNGYEMPRQSQTYEAIDENGNIVFAGTIDDIKHEYAIKAKGLTNYIINKTQIWNCDNEVATLRIKHFDGLHER